MPAYPLTQLAHETIANFSRLFPAREGLALPRPATDDMALENMTPLTREFEEGLANLKSKHTSLSFPSFFELVGIDTYFLYSLGPATKKLWKIRPSSLSVGKV